MQYYIDIGRKKRNTAGAKAPRDISEICRQRGMHRFRMPMLPTECCKLYQKLWILIVGTYYWWKLEHMVSEGDIVIYQHPMYGNRVAERYIPHIQKRKKVQFIAVIHYLESLRKGIDVVISQNQKTSNLADNILLKYFDVVICHNDYMKQYLISQGFEKEKLVSLNIFDYLNGCGKTQPSKGKDFSIAIAGNLAPGKCAYIYDIFGVDGTKNPGLRVHLYGSNYAEINQCENMIYHGSFSPEDLPEHLEGAFGLVWDGTSAETCIGNTGEYLKYNNPHKTSLYLSSGIPVIVWSKAAIADFVIRNGVGIAVDSLYDVNDRISEISEADYASMCENVDCIGVKLRSGGYFMAALDESLRILRESDYSHHLKS